VAEVAELPPGTALDAGCGEGADALWLAARGWRVTAVDIARTALDRAAAHAAGGWDLVSAQYIHLPPAERDSLVRRLAAAVAPGGTLLVVAHHPSDLETTIGRPALPEVFYTADELAAGLDPDRWQVVTADARPREEKDPDGRVVTMYRVHRHTGGSEIRPDDSGPGGGSGSTDVGTPPAGPAIPRSATGRGVVGRTGLRRSRPGRPRSG
jgi:SAM-dependent methyltransferase